MKPSLFVAALFACACAVPCATMAQNAGGAPAAPPKASGGLQEVIVTAQHRAESAQRAAVAVAVLPPSALAHVTGQADIAKLVPSVQMAYAGGANPLIYIRGVGTLSVNPYNESGVAVSYDGVYLGRSEAENGFFYDLDRIEVLKGPQGTLYGRNATGGAINVIPKQPVLNKTYGDLSVDGGNYSSYNVQGDVNLALGDNWALRVAGNVFGHAGYQTDGTDSAYGQGARVQLLYRPNATVSNRIAADYFHEGGTGGTATLTGYQNPSSSPGGVFTPTGFKPNVGMYDPRSIALLNSMAAFSYTAGAPYGALGSRPHGDLNLYGVNDELKVDLGFANWTTIAAVRFVDGIYTLQPVNFLDTEIDHDHQISLESRLNGSVGPVDWLVGVYYYNEPVKASIGIDYNTIFAYETISQQTQSYAGFARLTYHVTDKFRLTVAGRFTRDDRQFDSTHHQGLAICTNPSGSCPAFQPYPGAVTNFAAQLASVGNIPVPGGFFSPASGVFWATSQVHTVGSSATNKFTYRVAAEYDLRPESLAYISYETGYHAGGFEFSTLKPQYAPETIDAFTVGVKNRFFDDRLQVNIEGFIWKYNNQQDAHFGFGTNGPELITENIGRSTNQGVEVDIVAKPAPDTLLNADIQYLNAVDNSFLYNQPDFGSFSPTGPNPAGANIVPPPSACPHGKSVPLPSGFYVYPTDCSGKVALYSPMWSVNLGAQQSFHLTDDFKVTFEVDSHYQSSQWEMFERRAGGLQPGYWTVDASVTLYDSRRNWSLTGYVQNIGDERPMTAATFDSNAVYLTSALFGPPRTYGARLAVHF